MDSSSFDALTRRFAGSRREALTALALGALAALGGIADADTKKKKRKNKDKNKKKKKKKQCKSRCGGKCCQKGTAGALLFPEDGFGCTCCPRERIWTGSTGVDRCCAPGTRAVVGFTTNGGPCCPEDKYCNGECCNDGYVCRDGQCSEPCVEREVSAQLQTGGITRSGDITAEVTCNWPGNAQESCIEGYVCTDRYVCCRPEETPCGGYPGQSGACCRADEVCNPKFDADPDNHNFALDGRPCLKRC